MSNVVLVRVKDLAADQREWVARMFGRQPADDEQVSVMLFPSKHVPTAAQRQAAWQRIREILDKAADNARDVPEADFRGSRGRSDGARPASLTAHAPRFSTRTCLCGRVGVDHHTSGTRFSAARIRAVRCGGRSLTHVAVLRPPTAEHPGIGAPRHYLPARRFQHEIQP